MLSKELSKGELPPDVSVDGEVMEPEVIDVTDINVVHSRVLPCDSSEFNIFRVIHLNEMRSASWVVDNEFSHPPHESLSINSSITSEDDSLSMVELHEVSNIL